MTENRSDHRILCADLVELRWLDKSGAQQSAMANFEGISSRGANLVLDVGLPPKSLVKIHTPRGEFDAAIEDCRHEPDFGFALRVQLTNKSRWSHHGFRPRHLFDPRGLERREAERNRATEKPARH